MVHADLRRVSNSLNSGELVFCWQAALCAVHTGTRAVPAPAMQSPHTAHPPQKTQRAVPKGAWTKEEDETVIRLVGLYGPTRWAAIASNLPGRNGKQCRERWHNQLDPNIKRDSWTEEEDRILMDAHKELGSAWVEISKVPPMHSLARNPGGPLSRAPAISMLRCFLPLPLTRGAWCVQRLPGRTDNAIKNRWNSSMRKRYASASSPSKAAGSGIGAAPSGNAPSSKKARTSPSDIACSSSQLLSTSWHSSAMMVGTENVPPPPSQMGQQSGRMRVSVTTRSAPNSVRRRHLQDLGVEALGCCPALPCPALPCPALRVSPLQPCLLPCHCPCHCQEPRQGSPGGFPALH